MPHISVGNFYRNLLVIYMFVYVDNVNVVVNFTSE